MKHLKHVISPVADFELVQLQEKLRETEMVMENIVSNVQRSPDRCLRMESRCERSI